MKTNVKNKSRIVRYWEGLPIREAKHELRIFANESDATDAVPKDWGNCVFARACNRLYGSQRVAFFRSVAYVELIDEEGKRYIERFAMPSKLRKQIETFDKTHVAPPGGFLLVPPSPSKTLENRCKQNARPHVKKLQNMRNAKRRKAKVLGTKEDPGQPPQDEPGIVLEWRSGSGMVHFNSAKAIKEAKK